MNILPLILGFIMLLSILSASMFKSQRIFRSEIKEFCAYMEAKQIAYNKLEKLKFKNKKTKAKKVTDNLPKDPPKEKSFQSPRFKDKVPLSGKWNLASTADPYLEDALAKLWEQLYGHADFWIEAKLTIPDLGQAMVQALSSKEAQKLTDLFPQDPLLQAVFYKMLQGSGNYQLKEKKGYPPLGDFFTFEQKASRVMTFSCTPYLTLEVLLGEEIAKEILQKEQEKQATLNQEELHALLHLRGKDGLHFDKYFAYSFIKSKEKDCKETKGHATVTVPVTTRAGKPRASVQG